MLGPIIRSYKEKRENTKLKDKVDELRKLARASKKKLYTPEEWKKIRANSRLIEAYKEGVLNDNRDMRRTYYNLIMVQMKENIKKNYSELRKQNAKKSDIADLGLAIQKVAYEIDMHTPTIEKKKKELMLESEKVVSSFKKKSSEAIEAVESAIVDLEKVNQKAKKELESTMSEFEKKNQKNNEELMRSVKLVHNSINTTNQNIERKTSELSDAIEAVKQQNSELQTILTINSVVISVVVIYLIVTFFM